MNGWLTTVTLAPAMDRTPFSSLHRHTSSLKKTNPPPKEQQQQQRQQKAVLFTTSFCLLLMDRHSTKFHLTRYLTTLTDFPIKASGLFENSFLVKKLSLSVIAVISSLF